MTKRLTSVLERTSKLLQVGMGCLAAALLACQPGGSARVEASTDLPNAISKAASTPKRTLRPITAGMRGPTPATADKEMQLAALSPSAVAITPPRRAPLEEVVIDVMIAYTRAAASAYGDIVREVIEPAIASGNES